MGEGAVVEGVVRGPGYIGRGSVVEGSQVGPCTSVGGGCRLVRVEVGNSVLVDRVELSGLGVGVRGGGGEAEGPKAHPRREE